MTGTRENFRHALKFSVCRTRRDKFYREVMPSRTRRNEQRRHIAVSGLRRNEFLRYRACRRTRRNEPQRSKVTGGVRRNSFLRYRACGCLCFAQGYAQAERYSLADRALVSEGHTAERPKAKEFIPSYSAERCHVVTFIPSQSARRSVALKFIPSCPAQCLCVADFIPSPCAKQHLCTGQPSFSESTRYLLRFDVWRWGRTCV